MVLFIISVYLEHSLNLTNKKYNSAFTQPASISFSSLSCQRRCNALSIITFLQLCCTPLSFFQFLWGVIWVIGIQHKEVTCQDVRQPIPGIFTLEADKGVLPGILLAIEPRTSLAMMSNVQPHFEEPASRGHPTEER